MKSILVSFLLMFASSGYAQHNHNRHWHHHSDRGLAVLSGVLVGIAVAKASQAEPQVQPPVYYPPVSVPPAYPREFYPCIVWVPDARTGYPRQEFATCVK